MARKGRFFKARHIIFICLIVVLNILGVGYGYWNDGLQVQTGIYTGEIQIEFEGHNVEGDFGGAGGLEVNFGDDLISIGGEVAPGYTGRLNYYIRNKGSIPIMVNGERIEPGELSNQQEVIIQADMDNLESLIIEDFLDIEQCKQ